MKNKNAVTISLLFISAINIYCQKFSGDGFSKYLKNLPFEIGEIKVPSFPDNDFYITDFGAVGDGKTLNTASFEKAIERAASLGGGKIIVPKGIWLTGPITLKSNINLHLESGALIQFTNDFGVYPLVETFYEGMPQYRCASPINGRNLENVAISGSGIIDGNGDAWRYVKKFKLTENQWKELVSSGGVLNEKGDTWWPSLQAMEGEKRLPELLKEKTLYTKKNFEEIKDYLRPVMISLIECRNVLLDGPTFQNSPAWNIHPLMCSNLIVRNINVRNPWYSQNGDGIDVESCTDVLIYNCTFDVGDDAVCIKSGKDNYGRTRGIPAENIVIADCIVYHGHGGFTVGSEMSGGVRNVKLSNLNLIGTDVGLRFKSTRGRGGIVENIFIEDIFMKDIPADAIRFNLFYGGFAPKEDVTEHEQMLEAEEVPVDESTPRFQNIQMENIFCIGAGNALIIRGLPEMPVKNITMRNVQIISDKGISIYSADGIQFVNSKFESKRLPAVNIINSENILFDKSELPASGTAAVKIEGQKSRNIIFRGMKHCIENKIELGKDVAENVIIIE